jgi:hypothetical protein
MSERNGIRSRWWPRALLALALLGLGGAGRYIYGNYDVRLVRIDGATTTHDVETIATAVKPRRLPPIVVRLACVDAGAAVRSIHSPSRSLRQQLRQRDAGAPALSSNQRCKPHATALTGDSHAAAVVSADTAAVAQAR